MEIDLSSSNQQLKRKILDIEGSYTIPWIQSCRYLRFSFLNPRPNTANLRLALKGNNGTQEFTTTAQSEFSTPVIAPDEYELTVSQTDKNESLIQSSTYSPVAVGSIFAAIGDSITEGYKGQGYFRENLQLAATDFPADACSRDQRNFPQFAPTTHRHMPDVNCFKSWLSQLNDLLAAELDYPVFIANEGWGGITSGGYLNRIKNDTNWQARIADLAPSHWLIHLGVNDERQSVDADAFQRNMEQIITVLLDDYNAESGSIYLAKPCYDYFPDAEPRLQSYLPKIDQLIAEFRLSPGPGFFEAFSKNKQEWYGDDPVHPNNQGMDHMAALWFKAITGAK